MGFSDLVERLDINRLDHQKGVILLFFFLVFLVFCGFLSNLLDCLFLNGVFVLEGKHGFFNGISRDFEIFNDGSNDDLEDAESNGFLLEFGLPDESVHIDAKDSRAKVIEIDFRAIRLDFPYDDGLCDGGSLHLLGLVSFGLFLGFSSSCFVFFSFFTEKIITIISSNGFLLLNLLFLELIYGSWLGSSLWGSSGPLSTNCNTKLTCATPPSKCVGELFGAWNTFHGLKCLTISSSGLLSTEP